MSTTVDPALEAAVWDLEPLVEAKGPAGVEELLNEARERAAAFAESHHGQVADLGPEGLADAMHELGAIYDLAGRAGSYAMLWFTLDTTDPARGALIQRARELGRGHRDPAAVLRAGVEPAPRRARGGAAGRGPPRLLPPPSAQPAPLPPTPAERAGGARDDGAGRNRLLRVSAAVHRADLGRRGRPARRRRAGLAGSRAQPPPAPRPPAARAGRSGHHRGVAPGRAHARVPVQHAARRQDHQGPPARLPALAGLAQPRQRGERRVRRSPDRGRLRPLRAGPPLVPAQGAPARPRPARVLGSHGPAERHRGADPLRRGALDRAGLLFGLLARARRGRGGLLRRRLHRRPATAGQARRRFLLVHGPVAPPVRDAQLHRAPLRRARAGARARPRRARRAGSAAGHLPVHNPADAGGDGVDLRRDDRARAPAGARARTRRSGCRCWPARSTAPSARSSARSP